MYNSAAIAVVHDMETKEQRFFQGHCDDVMCIAVDRTGTLCATGQVAGNTLPYLCIWSIADCKEL